MRWPTNAFASSAKGLFEQAWDIAGPVCNQSPAIQQCVHLRLRRTSLSADDCASVTHTLARRCRSARNEADNRLLHVLLDPLTSHFFVRATDFANEDDGFGLGVVVEHLHDLNKSCSGKRVSTDSDAGGLSETGTGHFPHDFVGKRS